MNEFKNRFNKLLFFIMIMAAGAAICAESQASYPSGYYDRLNGKCGAELMTAVKSIVRNHTAITYNSGTWKAFLDTDVRTVNGTDYWWDMYSNNLVKVSSGHSGLNIEHTVANSWWGGTNNDAYKDLVHLNPSNSDANSRKSNYPIAELATVTWDNGVTFVGKPKSGQGGGASYCYEPADEYKGDFARVFMYMFTVYNDIAWRTSGGYGYMYDTSNPLMFKPWAQELLLKWSSNDPVSAKELNRNDGIYKNQKNRNPFIDLPELADHIWGSKSKVPFNIDGNYPDIPDDGGDDPEIPVESQVYEWLKSSDSSMGDWEIENVQLPSGSSYVWSWKEYNGSHYLNGSAFISQKPYAAEAYAWSPEVSLVNISSAEMTFSHAAKFQTNIRNVCKVAVRDTDSGEIFEEPITSWPAAGSWTFSSSGETDLSKYAGRNVQIGFKYASTDREADTWEINNVKLAVNRKSASIEIPDFEDEDDSILVEVWGNNILVPKGAVIYDLGGRQTSGENLAAGIYIVYKPTFKKAVKILIK